MNLNRLTIKQAQEKLANGEITSVDLTKACLARIKEVDDKIKACLTVCADEALAEAKEADKRRKKLGAEAISLPLLGIPYLAKDNILTRGVRTTAASKILENYIAPFDATVIKKLRDAGAVLLGKTNLDEFAHGASTENSAFGSTHNPWDLERVPGGSSGGSAAAVAANICLFALGTDTGGSIRCPSSFCGVTGLKPTYGRSSRFGLLAMTSSTDVPGPITKTVEDASIVLKIIAGHDKHDATTPEVEVPEYSEEFRKNIKGLKLGMVLEYFDQVTDKNFKEVLLKAVDKLKELGAEIVPVKLPYAKYGIPVYYIITPSEVSSNLARFDGIRYGLSSDQVKSITEVYTKSRGEGFGSEAKRRIMLGTYVLSAGYYDAYYLKAQKVRTKIKEELDFELEKVDAIITPTQPTVAFKIGEKNSDPLQMYLEDIFVTGPSLAGLPAISVPCGFSEGLPVGFQLIGKRFNEGMLLRIGHNYQEATEWHNQKPSI
ncbi:MAG: Asp-tRNA(Asn)/Glu-tRNA(Gln) amidotransferase subunit GatA [Patescibacteria group bacterium]|nr:Asp-tRNA(Asn)/Glu-tRNA(Gln) amidotransferase subunit GatA [Patescibacteria group bacterium]MDD4611276.1 Asp-tRNA(Asn)/Glu-tRNA(Gln) amidotransferase subunit GatA [Patescibacteria group bacterium]